MISAYKCGKCGVISDQKDHICQPQEVESRAEFCGSGPEHISQMCEPMAENLRFQCFTCGRPSEHPNLVCSPTPIR
jgi:hypothetical protein